MHVVECDCPAGSALGQDTVRRAYFHDSYRATLARPELGIIELFFALFGHTPLWMKLLLIVRNAVMKMFGLEVPSPREIMRPAAKSEYRLGEKIGPWPVFYVAETLLGLVLAWMLPTQIRPRDAGPTGMAV